VSEPVVQEMATGIRERTGADWAVSVSGIAGPSGGTEDKPVGTVWIAAQGPSGESYSKRYQWPGTRDQVRALAAHWALNAVRRLMQKGNS
jgi:nicotinamide-nucleotide amidase